MQATITFDASDYGGMDFDPRRAKVYATNNAVDQTIYAAGNKQYIGSGNGTIGPDGTGSITVPIPGVGDNPASWQTTIHFDVPDRNAPSGRRQVSAGPFTITGSGTLNALIEEMPMQPEYASEVLSRLDALEAGGVGGGGASGALNIASGGTVDLDNGRPNGYLLGYRVTATTTIEGKVFPVGTYIFERDTSVTSGWTYRTIGNGTEVTATPPETNPPTAGTLASSAVTTTGATVTVTGASDDTALAASPYSFSKDNGTTWTAYQSSNSHAWTGLTGSTAYQMRHRVKDAAGNVSTGTAITVTTSAAPVSISEDFTAADGTNLIGKTTTTGDKTWAADNAAAGVSASQSIAAINSNRLSGGTAAASINVATPNAKVTADYNSTGGRSALFVAGTNADDTIAVQIFDGIARMWTNINSAAVAEASCATSGTAELTYNGTTAVLKVGGTAILSYAVSGKTGTKAGVGVLGGSPWIDNVTVAAL